VHLNSSLDRGHESDYPEAAEGELTAPADFRPFYTLVEDGESGDYHHPHVHYIFSDDDHEIITSSIMESVEDDPELAIQERFVLVDIGLDGKSIVSAQSLEPDWQVNQAKLQSAPSWSESGSEKAMGGLMLNIEGAEGYNKSKGHTQMSQKQPQSDAILNMETVVHGYGERLARLEHLINAEVVIAPS